MPDNDYIKGRNYKSVRIKRIKSAMNSYNEKMNMPFTRALALLRELLTIGTISVRNCHFARKFIHEKMHPFFRDPGSVRELAELELLFQKAEERRARRKAKKLAAKAEGITNGTSGKHRKQQPTTTTTDPAQPPAIDVWDLL